MPERIGIDRLADVVEQRGQPDREVVARVGGLLHDGEDVVGELACRCELGDQRVEDARVPGEPKSLRGLAAEQKFRKLPHPVRGEAAADALT